MYKHLHKSLLLRKVFIKCAKEGNTYIPLCSSEWVVGKWALVSIHKSLGRWAYICSLVSESWCWDRRQDGRPKGIWWKSRGILREPLVSASVLPRAHQHEYLPCLLIRCKDFWVTNKNDYDKAGLVCEKHSFATFQFFTWCRVKRPRIFMRQQVREKLISCFILSSKILLMYHFWNANGNSRNFYGAWLVRKLWLWDQVILQICLEEWIHHQSLFGYLMTLTMKTGGDMPRAIYVVHPVYNFNLEGSKKRKKDKYLLMSCHLPFSART